MNGASVLPHLAGCDYKVLKLPLRHGSLCLAAPHLCTWEAPGVQAQSLHLCTWMAPGGGGPRLKHLAGPQELQ